MSAGAEKVSTTPSLVENRFVTMYGFGKGFAESNDEVKFEVNGASCVKIRSDLTENYEVF